MDAKRILTEKMEETLATYERKISVYETKISHS